MANLVEDLRNLNLGRLNEVNQSSAFPLMRWMSAKTENLEACERINLLFFKVPPKMVISLLHANCKPLMYVKYPKKNKEEKDDVVELQKQYLCKIYGWSQAEYEKNKSTLATIPSKELNLFINKQVGLDKKECKKLGVPYAEKKLKYQPKPTGLSSFM